MYYWPTHSAPEPPPAPPRLLVRVAPTDLLTLARVVNVCLSGKVTAYECDGVRVEVVEEKKT